VDINLTGGTHQVALYSVDWDSLGRTEEIDILDAASGTVLDTRSLSSFTGGDYLVWNLGGHIQIRFTNIGNPVASTVLSGLFFG
jgi:hypothetical protein